MAGFTRTQLEACRGATVPDLLAGPGDPPTRLLFVGINPGLWTAAAGAHFARRGNRFWPALHLAGITRRLIDASNGMSADDLHEVRRLGIGITNIAPIATARADELSAAELAAGGERLVALVRELRPAVVAVLGITAFRQALRAPATTVGRQPTLMGDSVLWVLPNPSGLNAHETVHTLAAAYREAAIAAGVIAV